MIDMVTEEAERRGGVQVTAVHLKLGPLSGVVKDALVFSWELACEGTQLSGSSLIVEDVPVRIHCSTCGSDRALPSLQHFVCPACDTPAFEILQGKELEVVALEIT